MLKKTFLIKTPKAFWSQSFSIRVSGYRWHFYITAWTLSQQWLIRSQQWSFQTLMDYYYYCYKQFQSDLWAEAADITAHITPPSFNPTCSHAGRKVQQVHLQEVRIQTQGTRSWSSGVQGGRDIHWSKTHKLTRSESSPNIGGRKHTVRNPQGKPAE